MLSIRELIHNMKKNTIKDNKRVESVRDVNYLIECINKFAEQMEAQEYCADLLQQLSSLDGIYL